jgi:hypothetical protein
MTVSAYHTLSFLEAATENKLHSSTANMADIMHPCHDK